jgi:anti-sigma factor RsiW
MNCQETQRWLEAYCDGELDMPRGLELEQHLRDCPACAQSRKHVTLAGKQIRAAAFNAPENLQERIRAAVLPERKHNNSTSRPVRPWFFWGLSTAAASLVLAFILAQTVFRPGPDGLVLNEIADSHIRSLIGNHLVDVASSDQHTVRPWFEGKVDFAPAVPDLSARGFEIVGGRLDYISGRPAAALVYRSRKHYISLFIWPSGAANKAVQSIGFESKPAQRGYEVLHWNSGGMSHWAISEISSDELRDFAKAFASELAGH